MEWYKNGMYPEWHLKGESFSPKKLQSQFPYLILSNSHEKNDISPKGRFMGQELDNGSTKIVVAENIVHKLDWLLDFIIANSKTIRQFGVEDEIIWIYWYGIQGNMELNSPEIMKLSSTGLDVAMTYIYIDSLNE